MSRKAREKLGGRYGVTTLSRQTRWLLSGTTGVEAARQRGAKSGFRLRGVFWKRGDTQGPRVKASKDAAEAGKPRAG